MNKGAQLTAGALTTVLLLGWYGWTNLGAEATYRYYQTVEEFRAAGDLEGESLRVHGYVAIESIERNLEAKRVAFEVQSDPPHAGGPAGSTLSVVYPSLDTPDLFKDGAEVVVEGRLERQGAEMVFVADNVLAKCPSKFQAKVGEERETTL